MVWPLNRETPYLRSYAEVDAAVARHPLLTTAHCGYHNFTTTGDQTLWEHLHPTLPLECEPKRALSIEADVSTFNGFEWAEWTSHNWHVPIIASVIYVSLVPTLRAYMKEREPIRLQPVVLAWNFGLSLFSLAGMLLCVPHLLVGDNGLFTAGFTASICTHPATYGSGYVGMFVAFFIYSKLFELVDTLWLTLRKAPVIFLHWYHHVTVLLYCWHSYSSRIATGLWFAAMNYSVHAIMYFYFGLTQLGPRGKKVAKKFAMFITTLQLLQMVGGIVVTVGSMVQHAKGATCFVPLSNSFLGLIMYSSYFALFLQLFLSHYVYNKKPRTDKPNGAASRNGGSTTTYDAPSCPSVLDDAIKNAADGVMKGKPSPATRVGKKEL